MNRGDNVLITYVEMNSTIIATFLEETDKAYLMKNISGIFAITKSKVANGLIIVKVIEE